MFWIFLTRFGNSDALQNTWLKTLCLSKYYKMQILKYSYCQVLLFTILLLVIITAWNVSKSVRICSYSGPNFPGFGTNTGKCGPEKLQIHTLFTQLISIGSSSSEMKTHLGHININSVRNKPCQCQFGCFYDLKNLNCWNALRITIYCCKLFRTLL